MRNQTSAVSVKDFERYNFTIPLNKLYGQKRTSYIVSELMKRHPCFSDEFCYDSRICVNKNGFLADVIVMSRLKYVSFRRLNPVSKYLGLKFEEVKGKRFLPSSLFLLGSAVLCVLSVILICAGKMIGDNHSSLLTEQTVETQESFSSSIYGSLITNFVSFLKLNTEANVTSLEWKNDGFSEYLTMELKNCYSDSLSSFFKDCQTLDFSNLIYQNGLPSFSVNIKDKCRHFYQENIPIDSPFRIELRHVLESYEVNILEEKSSPFGISFEAGVEIAKILGEMADYLQSANIHPSYLRISSKDKVKFLVILELFKSNDISDMSILHSITESGLFLTSGVQKSLTDYKNSGGTQTLRKINRATTVEIRNKVGEVVRENGEKVIYYKDDYGKMKSVVVK